ncbi:hypothetical protein [Parasitella parasitica]|uniref:CCHC-type domain-containing protein n=1 Tax=Parasitella parasitica TaxID=35722 RepID=A0A0B7N1Z2_9FUNG|nr:hypothetical protein [Parasitella parasitica]
MLKFNEDSEKEGFYEDFLGRRKQTRHDFWETIWLFHGKGRRTLIDDDATIVRLKLENLPFLPAMELKAEMAERLSCFGEVLDYGISKSDGIFQGEGYATLNLSLADSPDNECMESHADGSSCSGQRHLEPLSRVIIWDPRADEQRKVLLQWDKMPDFCRNCQSTEHCRADCPDYKKWIRCFDCNETGHVMRNCKRNGSIESAPAKIRVISNPGSLPKPRKSSKEPLASYIGSSPQPKDVVTARTSTQMAVPPPHPQAIAASDKAELDYDADMVDSGNSATTTDADALKSISHDVDMQYTGVSTPRSPSLDPTKALKKAARTDGSTDISSLRSTSSASLPTNTGRPPTFSQLAVILMNNIQNTLKIANLNCRGLKKTDNHIKRQQFIRYIRTLGHDILSSLWTQHCGIVSLPSIYTINHIADGIDDGRFILALLTLTHDEADSLTNSPIATILNIYGRLDLPSARSTFYSELLSIPTAKDTITNTNINNTILIMGDFNYQYKDCRLDGSLFGAPTEWTDLLDDYYIDVFGEDKQDTWNSGRSSGILDYIFCSSNAHHLITSIDQHYMSPEWTDHELLGCSFQYTDISRRGPGSWKANHFLARNKNFCRALAHHLESNMEQFNAIKMFSSPQQQWDWIKGDVKIFIKGFQREDLNWRKKQLHKLLAKRNASMRHSKHRGLESIAEIEILKSGKYWRENGKKSAGFLKRTIAARENKRTIRELRDPNTETLYPTALAPLIRYIPPNLRLSSEQQDGLMEPIDIDDLLEESKCTPRKSSPGPGGRPYEVLYLVLKFPTYQGWISEVYNTALQRGEFPSSWNESLMYLLYKKGDSADIRSYRPLSLTNIDYKLFTRILNRRIMEVSSGLISRHQLGFLPGRFIAENGMIYQLIMEDAQRKWAMAGQRGNDPQLRTLDADIGLLLD